MNLSKNLKNKFFSKEAIISLVIIIFIFVLDRVSKIKIIKHQTDNDGSLYISDYLNFDLIWNTGIGFGLLSQNVNIYYNAITFLIFLVIIFLSYLVFKVDR